MIDYHLIKTEQKALEINLNEKIYGTFAEIGAGQEVARNFFQAGAASATIAKTMSAYDKTYSDAIYGVEESGRYVCESRLYKMLDHEWQLLEERLSSIKPDTTFFVFADTVSTINFGKTNKGHGWLGLRFQLYPQCPPNDLVIHVKLTDNDSKQQQEAIGILGVNLLYAAYYYSHNLELMVKSLHDSVQERATIDLIQLNGQDFIHTNGRLLCYYLVKHGLTEVTMFDEKKQAVHASEFLYKKSLMVVRGHFKPATLVTLDVIRASYKQFLSEQKIEKEDASVIAELTLENLMNEHGMLDDQDFLDRTEVLCEMGLKVIISNCNNHQMLINYLNDYKILHLGIVIGVHELLEIINEKYYQNQDGRLLVAFGELFTRNIKIYGYPALQNDSGILTIKNLPIPSGIKFLYKYLMDSNQIIEVKDYNPDILHILPHVVRDQIKNRDENWKKGMPSKIIDLIEQKGLFGYKNAEKEQHV